MRTTDWSWPARISFVMLGVTIGMSSMMVAFADDGACTTRAIPGVITPHYDLAGNMVFIEDHVNRQEGRLTYRGNVLDDISLSHYIKERAKPDRWGRTEQWGPHLWNSYNVKTGKLMNVRTYEKNVQLNYELPANIDFEALRDPKDGLVRFTAQPESCDSLYTNCKKLEARTIVLPEPLISGPSACLSFGGAKFALNRAAKIVAAPKLQNDATAPKVIAPKAAPGSSHQVCVEKLCITVHDDDQPDESWQDESAGSNDEGYVEID